MLKDMFDVNTFKQDVTNTKSGTGKVPDHQDVGESKRIVQFSVV